MSRIVMDDEGQAGYEKMEQTGCVIEETHEDWIKVINYNEKLPFAINRGEMMRVFINDGKDDVTSLLIMAHHLAGDGKSIEYFVEDMLLILNNEDCPYRPLKLLTEDNIPDKHKLPAYVESLCGYFNKKWRKDARVFSWQDYTSIHNVYWKNNRSRIMYRKFTPKEVVKIHDYCKKNSSSINSCIVTAFLAADLNIKDTGLPVAAREDGNKCMSNQTTGVKMEYRYKSLRSFTKNMKIVHKKIYRTLNKPGSKYFVLKFIGKIAPNLLDSALFYAHGLCDKKLSARLSNIMGYTGNNTRELGVTNLTKLDIRQNYSRYSIKDVVFIPPVVSYARKIVGISTNDSGMMITYHYMGTEEKKSEHEFFNTAIDRLLSL